MNPLTTSPQTPQRPRQGHGRAAAATLGILALLLALALATSAATGHARPSQSASPTSGDRLFLQQASTGTLAPVRGRKDRFVLTLKRSSARVISFTDRPRRGVSSETTRSFVSKWSSRFGTSAPNAAIEVEQGGRHHVMVVTLSKPRYDARADTVTYRVRRLVGDTTPGLRRFRNRSDQTVPRSFGHIDLFIDPSDQPLVRVRLSVVTPIADATVVSFTNAEVRPEVSFSASTGPTVLQTTTSLL
jgi:hypothetical protein